jgi:phospho-N-acetylmuramoyl-pentapeptide-transferase
MLYWLTQNFHDFWAQHGLSTYMNVFRYQTLRTMMAVLTAFLLTMIIAPPVIRLLRRLKVGSAVDFHMKAINEKNASKKDTPTMGGLIIVSALIGSTLLWGHLGNFYVFLAMMTVVWLAVVGFADDYLKMIVKSRDGLKMWEKLAFQVGLAVLLGAFLWANGRGGIDMPVSIPFPEVGDAMPLTLPFWKHPLALGLVSFMVVSVIVIGGTSNAVNLTDGMDGLAGGCVAMVTLVFMVVAYITGRVDFSRFLLFPYVQDVGELSVFCGAILGSVLGFLWFNCNPARVFMGDTGSLPLGGAIGFVAMATRQEVMLFIVGGVFVMEAVSVMIQVPYFKLSGGKRIFAGGTPIHHHFNIHMHWSETQTVMRFWLIGAMCAAMALATLKVR